MKKSSAPAAFIPFAFPGLARVGCLFSTAVFGDMRGSDNQECATNREKLMSAAGFSRWAELHQVHGHELVEAAGTTAVVPGTLAKADAHYTFEPGLGLMIKTADCQPLLFARRDGGAVAGLHLGWRGNAGNFIKVVTAELCRRFSCPPGDLLCVRGPSLGPAAAEFVNFAREWPDSFARWYDAESRTVNLWQLSRCQLIEAGLRPEKIYSLDLCTHTMAEWFFSHRRGDVERQISAVWIKD